MVVKTRGRETGEQECGRARDLMRNEGIVGDAGDVGE